MYSNLLNFLRLFKFGYDLLKVLANWSTSLPTTRISSSETDVILEISGKTSYGAKFLLTCSRVLRAIKYIAGAKTEFGLEIS